MRCARLCIAIVGFACAIAGAQPVTDVREVYRALLAKRFGAVETLYSQLVQGRTRNPDGEFGFEQFVWNAPDYSTDDPNSVDYWPKVDALTAEWVAHSPKSYVAAISRARALVRRGEHLEATNGSWTEVDRYASEARRLVDRSREAGYRDANWHAVRLRVASLEGTPRADVLDEIRAAVQVDPYPILLWQDAAFALSPYGRSAEDLPWLMNFAVQHTSAKEGTTMYARVFAQVYWFFPDLMNRPFGPDRVNWDLMKKSLAELKVRYPHLYDPNMEGALACVARDRSATAAAFRAMGSDVHEHVWERFGGKPLLARCKAWALFLRFWPPS
jgi:hypothetical protein